MQKLSGSFSTDPDTELWAIDSSEKKVDESAQPCQKEQKLSCFHLDHFKGLSSRILVREYS